MSVASPMSSPVALAGKKRKWDLAAEEDVATKLSRKFRHGFKDVRKSVKKAKTFETQKLVKKLKHLRNPRQNADEALTKISDIETQLQDIKRIDQERIAHLALSSKIRKDKRLSTNIVLISALASAAPVSSTLETQHTTTESKAENKLLSSKIIAGQVDLVLSRLSAVIAPEANIELASNAIESTKTYVVDGVEIRSEGQSRDSSSDELVIKNIKKRKLVGGQDEIVDGADHFVDDGGWESGSVHTGNSESSDDNEPVSTSQKHKQTRVGSQKGSSGEDRPNAVSKFLPSLAVGFIKGNSEHDFEETEHEKLSGGRNNRRGQRARQAIWEKKYGKNANHVKKRREEDKALATARTLGKQLDGGWNGKRGATKSMQRDKALDPSQSGPYREERPLHPSWEAKQRLKEEKDGKILPSQGERLVFT